MRLTVARWICDLCFVVDEANKPVGWEWHRSAMTGLVAHRCAACVAKTLPEHRGLPLGVESAHQHFARK